MIAQPTASLKRTAPVLRYALLLAFGLFLIQYLLPLLTGTVWIQNDLGNFAYPLRSWYADRLKAGESFLWNPDLYAGTYLHAEGQQGMLHPVHLITYFLLPAPIAFNLGLVLAMASIAFGFYRFFDWLLKDSLVAGVGAFWASLQDWMSITVGSM